MCDRAGRAGETLDGGVVWGTGGSSSTAGAREDKSFLLELSGLDPLILASGKLSPFSNSALWRSE